MGASSENYPPMRGYFLSICPTTAWTKSRLTIITAVMITLAVARPTGSLAGETADAGIITTMTTAIGS